MNECEKIITLLDGLDELIQDEKYIYFSKYFVILNKLKTKSVSEKTKNEILNDIYEYIISLIKNMNTEQDIIKKARKYTELQMSDYSCLFNEDYLLLRSIISLLLTITKKRQKEFMNILYQYFYIIDFNIINNMYFKLDQGEGISEDTYKKILNIIPDDK